MFYYTTHFCYIIITWCIKWLSSKKTKIDTNIWRKKSETLHNKIFSMNQTAWSLKYISSIKTEQQMIEDRVLLLYEYNGMEFWHLVSWIKWYDLINTKKNFKVHFALTVWQTTVVMMPVADLPKYIAKYAKSRADKRIQ